ncbi:MAG: glycoside hydrolase family 3 C-terminal domain-containing protein [Clostridiales bacterium]|nr:glycoside hydrolase family 3 C-terminal domain-containing protein [Clostridiales bacterium]
MLAINWDDVWNVVSLVIPHLIAIVAAIVVAIVVIVLVKKLAKPVKRLVRGEACIAMILVILIAVNMMCTGPLSSLLTQVAGTPVSYVSDETADEAMDLITEISEEGITLLENEDSILPLTDTKVNVFGWSATNPCYGGTGSGALNDAYDTTTFLDGLTNAGIEYNTDLIDFYTEYHDTSLPNVGMWSQDWTLPQPYADDYSDDLISGAQEYSDTAIIFISRVGGEGADLPTDMTAVVDGTWAEQNGSSGYYAGTYDDTVNDGTDWDEGDHYLQLSNPEEEMVELVCSNFDNVIVIYNGANAFELGFVDDYDSIKGVIWCAGTGQSGFDALGEILTGAVNPSGRLVDTYVYDLTATPTWNNAGNFEYDNMDEYIEDTSYYTFSTSTNGQSVTFVNYVESIYVGYKFYTTAAAEGLIDYDETVQYSFGYGLSYTEFTQEISNFSSDGTNITFDVTVTNTGTVAGKDVVEIYFNPPYTNGGIEKATANLLDFEKTDTLGAGESQTISFSIPIEQMASYDTYGYGCYVLEQGDYIISINSDANTIIDSVTYTVDETIVYDEDNPRDSDEVAATNQFDYAEGDVTYLSRADGFANYDEATAAPTSYSMSDEAKEGFYNVTNYLTAEATAADEDADAEYPTWGADNGVELVDLRGLDYDDELWDDLLDELTLEDAVELISLGGYQTAAIDSIGKYRTNDCDGPASINNNFTGAGSPGFPAAVMIAATWNDDMALAFGESIGKMADEMDTSGWYAPAMNIHRTAFAGRNFEYYSEDAVLSGSMAANATIGAEEYGVYAYIKHFALNDQEANRLSMLCTWCTEQAMRENYLRAFEIAVKEGGAKAVMSSFNYIGNRWAGGNSELLQTVLRDEWGFEGMVLTDYFGVYGYMSADQAVRNGTDFVLVNYATSTSTMQYTESAGAQQAIRTSLHNILYVVVNSRAYSDEGIALATQNNIWENILLGVNIAVAVILVAWEVFLIYSFMKKRKAGQQ